MSKYGDYLKSVGATAEEITVLDTPTAERAYEKLQAEAERAVTLDKQYKDYQAQVTDWYNQNDAKLKETQTGKIAAEAEAARHKAALMEAQRQGLIDVAKDLNWAPEALKPADRGALDDRYVSMDKFQQIADGIGGNLAALEDMVMEHRQLFPDKPLSVRQLRAEAVAANKSVYDYWVSKFKVGEARESAATKQRDAEIAKWKAEGAKEKETELVSKFGNPETRPMVPSRSPFAP